ncbi:PAS domain S-box protein [Azonexus sp.]|uniref:hybrid sensor histidine kinase/response regulator n=1 Tax=Azonexus sp. TaxID=1872668 RepID=UPI0027BABEA4|nr:PAS domain S-box protein [Azonexus sp.]
MQGSTSFVARIFRYLPGAQALQHLLSSAPKRADNASLLRSILDLVAAEVAVIDRQGVILAVNEPWRRFSLENAKFPDVATPNTLTGANYFSTGQTDRLDDDDASRARLGIQAVLDGRLPVFSMEYTCDSAGQKRWFTMTARPLPGKNALPDGAVITHVDISQSKAAEEKAKQAEHQSAQLLQAFEQSPTSMFITNREGVIEYVNPRFTQLTGYDKQEIIGQRPGFLKSGLTTEETYEDLWRTLAAGKSWRGLLCNRTKDGKLIWEDTSIAPIVNAEQTITHFITTKENVTAKLQIENELAKHRAHLEEEVAARTAELSRALEAARVAERTKDEFLANITHELRTPLAAVIGFSRLARPLCNQTTQGEYLDSVIEAGKTLGNIIDDLLDLSKIVAGAITFDAKPFSIRRLLSRVNTVISYRISEKGLILEESIAEEVPDVLIGDALRIEQILLNLLSNAIKFTSRGHIRTRINLVAMREARACIDISVEDSGIGIDQESIPLLFKPFSQADASVTRRFGGTGLGLAICARLAALMDGDIEVSSKPGIGSRFDVRLWLTKGDSEQLQHQDEEADTPLNIRYRDTCVLVVDDQAMNRELVEILLKNVGIAVDLARNGEQALNMLFNGKKNYDLVMMDIQMPVMDGHTATHEIRKKPHFQDLPIIAMTAHTMVHERERTLQAGMNDHLGKPFDEPTFYRVLARWIGAEKQVVISSSPETPDATETTGHFPEVEGIDLVQVRSLMRNDADRFVYWLRNFLTEGPAAVEKIRQSLTDEDRETASMTAHMIKGRCGLLGMSRLHQVSANLETTIEAGQPADALLEELTALTATMCENIRQAVELPHTALATAIPPTGSATPTT